MLRQTPHYQSENVLLYRGDCLDALKDLPDESIDAIVTDPPYELGFLGKAWDSAGIAFDPKTWAACLRVLKPGGHLLAFGGTRTYHRIACAIEDAGFEVRDSLHWMYGSGFPKSLDVSKALDKAAGAEREVVAVRGTKASGLTDSGYTSRIPDVVTAPATDAAKEWSGWGTALKPAHEPVIVARKPLTGTVAANVQAHGTGALNIDGCRVEGAPRPVMARTNTVVAATAMAGVSTGATATGEMTTEGRWPPNVLLTHAPDCLEDACVEGCPARVLGEQSGQAGASAPVRGTEPSSVTKNAYNERDRVPGAFHADTGTAARFFPQFRYDDTFDTAPFRYVAKAARKERELGCESLPADSKVRNSHPTVKPVALMRWLVRLVTPPGGIVLDPFTGSGTTGIAAVQEGLMFIGVEREPEYMAIAEARIRHAKGS